MPLAPPLRLWFPGGPRAYAAGMTGLAGKTGGTEEHSRALRGRRVLITGATGGIGRATAQALAGRGADVVLLGRDPERTGAVAREIGAAGVVIADLAELEQVARAAAEYRERFGELDVLVNNAGAVFLHREETREGIERTWAVNHLASFLLTRELLPLLRRSSEGGEPARVVTVASAAHVGGRLRFGDPEFKSGYSLWAAYAQSKLANVLFARELARREPGLQSNSLHPGMVATNLGANNGGWTRHVLGLTARVSLTPEQGARASIHLAADPVGVSGAYFVGHHPVATAPQAQDDGAAARLWALSEAYVTPGTPGGLTWPEVLRRVRALPLGGEGETGESGPA